MGDVVPMQTTEKYDNNSDHALYSVVLKKNENKTNDQVEDHVNSKHISESGFIVLPQSLSDNQDKIETRSMTLSKQKINENLPRFIRPASIKYRYLEELAIKEIKLKNQIVTKRKKEDWKKDNQKKISEISEKPVWELTLICTRPSNTIDE